MKEFVKQSQKLIAEIQTQDIDSLEEVEIRSKGYISLIDRGNLDPQLAALFTAKACFDLIIREKAGMHDIFNFYKKNFSVRGKNALFLGLGFPSFAALIASRLSREPELIDPFISRSIDHMNDCIKDEPAQHEAQMIFAGQLSIMGLVDQGKKLAEETYQKFSNTVDNTPHLRESYQIAIGRIA